MPHHPFSSKYTFIISKYEQIQRSQIKTLNKFIKLHIILKINHTYSHCLPKLNSRAIIIALITYLLKSISSMRMKRYLILKINAKSKTIVEYAILVAFIAILTFIMLYIILKLINNFCLDQNLTESITNLNNLYYS